MSIPTYVRAEVAGECGEGKLQSAYDLPGVCLYYNVGDSARELPCLQGFQGKSSADI